LDRLTGRIEAGEKARIPGAQSERADCTAGEGFIACSRPVDSCRGAGGDACCRTRGRSVPAGAESVSARVTGGKKSRKHLSGAADLACILLFGHTAAELLEADDTAGSS
jgi:hypothetical protein